MAGAAARGAGAERPHPTLVEHISSIIAAEMGNGGGGGGTGGAGVARGGGFVGAGAVCGNNTGGGTTPEMAAYWKRLHEMRAAGAYTRPLLSSTSVMFCH